MCIFYAYGGCPKITVPTKASWAELAPTLRVSCATTLPDHFHHFSCFSSLFSYLFSNVKYLVFT